MSHNFLHTYATNIIVALTPLSSQAQSEQDLEITPAPANQLRLEWSGVKSRTYFMQQSTGLTSWSYVPSLIEQGKGLPLFWNFTRPAGSSVYFTRLKFTDTPSADPSITDFDGDGVATLYELTVLNTDPLLANSDGLGTNDGGGDSDGDGMPDALELAFFSNLTAQMGSGDADNDGLTNAEELALANDPNINEAASLSNKTSYLYDLLGRLKNVSGRSSAIYNYDPEGNLTAAQ